MFHRSDPINRKWAFTWALALAILWIGLPAQSAGVLLFLSPDGSHICRQADDGFSLWELATGKNKASWGPAPDDASRPVFRADGQELLTLSANGLLRVTQVMTGKPRLQLWVKDLNSLTSRRALALHPQGNWIALKTDGYTSKILATRPAAQPQVLKPIGDIDYPDLMAYSPNSRWLAYAGTRLAPTVDDGESNSVLRPTYTIYLRTAVDGAMTDEVVRLNVDESLWEMDFSPQSDLLAITSDSGLYLWDTASRKKRHFLPEAFQQAVFSPDGSRFATAMRGEGYEAQIGIYDSKSGEQLQLLPQNPDTLSSMAFSRDGKSLLVAESDTVKVLDPHIGLIRSYRFVCQKSCRLSRSDLAS